MSPVVVSLLACLALSLFPASDPSPFVGANGYYAGHQVIDLPGQPLVEFKHYSGYITLLPDQDHKALFYWFFEATSEASEKPLVLWLTGGPGCSSIGIGAVQENGPFLIDGNGSQLILNKYSWNRAANMLYLESPVGVGFSYSNHSNDLYELGDKVTADDAHAFLINWFTKFPIFQSHDFYIAGESYAGHYVPQLAEVIWERNKGANREKYINLKGFMIGNALLNKETDDKGVVDFAWSHGLISDRLHHNLLRCLLLRRQSGCNLNDTDALLAVYSRVNFLGIYAPICSSVSEVSSTNASQTQQQGIWHTLPRRAGFDPDPCAGKYVMEYFNRKDVQRALHANITKMSYPYMLCRDVTDYKWIESSKTVLPIMKKLLDIGLRIWVYSGDTDARIPLTSTRYSINKMKLTVKEEWRIWFDHDHDHDDKSSGQLAGWAETYEGGLVLATVHGAGHQVPSFAPHQSLSLFSHFLSNKTLPHSPSY